jgi:O-antigen/teichoic acid export membrane protein
MKAMNVKMIALSNLVGLTISGAVGIWMALTGWGPWALVWQSIILASVKTIWLWSIGRWVPRYGFHMDSMRQIYRVGLGVFSSSFLNTVFLNIYSFIIGAYYNLAALGNYTQADKWSKMGSASISQILTASFVPLLSQYQDDGEKYRALIGKINRFTSFILFPFMCWLIVMAEPVFHLMFGTKWDTAIPLFQILLLRGIFTVLTSLYNNYILSLGHARSLVVVEFVKDALTLIAIVSTIAMQSVEALVWGQMIAGAATYLFILWLASRNTGYSKRRFLIDMAPYALLTILTMVAMWSLSLVITNDILLLISQLTVGAIVYYTVLRVTGSTILMEAQSYITSHFRKK